MEIKKCDRQFRWISSISGDPDILSSFNEQMAWFYGQQDGREMYQSMLDTQENIPTDNNSVRHLMPKYICDIKPQTILEIGSANGRMTKVLFLHHWIESNTTVARAKYFLNSCCIS